MRPTCKRACPAARITPGLPIRGADGRELAALADWLEEETEHPAAEEWGRAAEAQNRAGTP